MSTKLYNGIKFKSNNIREVLDQLISIKDKAKQIALDSIKDKDLDLFINCNKLLEKDPFDISREMLTAMDNTHSGIWRFVPNIHFSVVIYPTVEGDIYGYYFDSNKKEYRDLLEPFYTDFHYQNQSDRPDDISNEEWDFRCAKWDELLEDRFKETGLSYEIVTGESFDIWEIEDKVKSIIGILKRDKTIEDLGIK